MNNEFRRYVCIYDKHQQKENTSRAISVISREDWPLFVSQRFSTKEALTVYILHSPRSHIGYVGFSGAPTEKNLTALRKSNEMILRENELINRLEDWLDEVAKRYLEGRCDRVGLVGARGEKGSQGSQGSG